MFAVVAQRHNLKQAVARLENAVERRQFGLRKDFSEYKRMVGRRVVLVAAGIAVGNGLQGQPPTWLQPFMAACEKAPVSQRLLLGRPFGTGEMLKGADGNNRAVGRHRRVIDPAFPTHRNTRIGSRNRPFLLLAAKRQTDCLTDSMGGR